MKYVFFGSPEFAAIILRCLIATGMPPALVVCNPDRPVGRKKIITSPPTKMIAAKHGIPVCQPERLSVDSLSLTPSSFSSIDFFLVAAYAQIIPEKVLKLPRLGTIGVHPSLLPYYRGATPIQSVILNGDTETGVTLYTMDDKMDHGEIVKNEKCKVKNEETYTTLLKKLAELSGVLLIETLSKFMKGEIILTPQDHTQATFTKKFETADGFVDLAKDDPIIIDRKVRALNPDPGVYTFVDGKRRMKILETEIVDEKLQLIKVQMDGKKPITVR